MRWAVLSLGALTAGSALADPGTFLLTPDIHGDRVAFTREGDIWIGNLQTGEAHRLTRYAGLEQRPRFSPDGTRIAFTAQYEGPTQVYVMPVDGGIPVRITNHLNAATLDDWTPDGSKLLCRGPGAEGVPEPFFIPAAGGAEERIPLQKMGMGTVLPDGRLAFTRFGDIAGGAWFRYAGGSRNDIWVGDLTALTFKKVFESKTQAQYPQYADGRIYFVQENNATWTINSVGLDGGGAKKLTAPSDDQIYELQSDGTRMVYVRGANLYMYDPATAKESPISMDLNSDLIHMRPTRVDAAAFVESGTMTPTAKRLLMETRGQILSVPVKEGETRLWKAIPGVRLQKPVMSPDGKMVAYVSDESREQQVYVSDADGNGARAITKDSGRQLAAIKWSPTNDWIAVSDSELRIRLVKADGSEDRLISTARRDIQGLPHAFSPDGKWLAYVEQKPWTNQQTTVIMLHNIAENKSYPITDGRYFDIMPAFSSDGRFLAFVSNRAPASAPDPVFSYLGSNLKAVIMLVPLSKSTASPFLPKNADENTPEPEKPAATNVDLNGIMQRRILVPLPPAAFTQVEVVGDRVLAAADGAILTYDMSTKTPGTLTSGGGFEVSADHKSVMIPDASFRVIPVGASAVPPNAGVVSLTGFKLDIDPAKEWEQIFWDAWRLQRDYFYVRNMHGADWDGVGKKYAALLPSVHARNELTELIRWMQAELSIGHSFRAEPPIFTGTGGSTPAFLGAETVADGGYHRITRLYDGDGIASPSPLMEPGQNVSEGDYILSVNGKETPSSVDWREYLRDRAGQVVSLVVNGRPSMTGARTIYVKPHSAAVERVLLEYDAVKKKREYVDKKSGGKVGYIYLGGMSDPDMDDFILQYFGQLDKDAIIIDIRENNGGYISAAVVELLKKETYLRRSQRNSIEASTRYTDAFEGHLTMLINEDSYSDGEGGPTNWKFAKLGPLIGTPTYGALVGSAPMWPLVDGGGIQVPRYGNFREDIGWAVEGPGAQPDIYVDNDPNHYVRGVDDQLDRAIAEMLAAAAKDPIKRPVQPKDPTKSGTRGG
jgi:tricorn protease